MDLFSPCLHQLPTVVREGSASHIHTGTHSGCHCSGRKAPERKRDHGYKHGWFLWGLIPRPHASVGLSHSCRELQGLWKVCSSLCPEGKENVFWPTWKSLLQIL